MSEYESEFYELDWDAEIENEGNPFVVVPEGDYTFRVDSFERARHNGSEKVPACNKAVLKLTIAAPGQKATTLQTNLLLYSKFEWKLCQFFSAIGQRKHGEPLRMNWNSVVGSVGRCHITTRKWTGKDGNEHDGNEIDKFYELEDPDEGASSTSPAGYVPGQF